MSKKTISVEEFITSTIKYIELTPMTSDYTINVPRNIDTTIHCESLEDSRVKFTQTSKEWINKLEACEVGLYAIVRCNTCRTILALEYTLDDDTVDSHCPKCNNYFKKAGRIERDATILANVYYKRG